MKQMRELIILFILMMGISSVWAQDFTVESGSTLTVTEDIEIDGTLEVLSGGTLDTRTFVISGTGMIVIDAGANLIVGHANGISGMDQTTSGSTYSSGANYEFKGASTGTFVTNPTANTVNNLIINSSGTIDLAQNITVSSTITFTSGTLKLGDYVLTANNYTGTPTLEYSGSGYATGIGDAADITITTYSPIQLPSIVHDLAYSTGFSLPNNVRVDGNLSFNYSFNLGNYNMELNGTFTGNPEVDYQGTGIITGIDSLSYICILCNSISYLPPLIHEICFDGATDYVDLPNDIETTTIFSYGWGFDLNGKKITVSRADFAITNCISLSSLRASKTNFSQICGTETSIPRTWTVEVYASNNFTMNFTYPTGLTGDHVKVMKRISGSSDPWEQQGGTYLASDVSGMRTVSVSTEDVSHVYEYTLINYEETLPVELTTFAGVFLADKGVTLNWTSQTESNGLGYNIYRNESSELATAQRMNFSLIQAANSSTANSYTYTDNELLNQNTDYYYWLQYVEMDGSFYSFGPAKITVTGNTVENPAVPVHTALNSTYPNPFNPSTTISYALVVPANVNIEVFNSKGQLVKSLVNKHQNAGDFRITWEGKDNNNKTCTSGVYFIKMNADNYSSIKKVMLIK